MRYLLVFLFAALMISVTSCLQCAFLDCLSSDYSLSFRIVSTADSTDLVFGRHRVYDRDLFRFYSIKGPDTTFYDLHPSGYYLNAPEDSVLNVQFFPRSDTAYMKLSNGDIDTITMTFDTYKSKCCGTITEITNFRLNNKIDLPGKEGTQIIKK